MQVNNYIGKIKISIVDTLPAGIDVDASDLAGGRYNSENNTITWEEEKEINGDYDEVIEKEIIVVYEGQDVTKPLINTAKGIITTYYPEGHTPNGGEEKTTKEKETTSEVEQEYKVEKTVEKIWEDNNNLKGKRPESVNVCFQLFSVDKISSAVSSSTTVPFAVNCTFTLSGLFPFTLLLSSHIFSLFCLQM